MLHRRLLDDDSRGVDEALNDSSVVHTPLWVVYGDQTNATRLRHYLAYYLQYPASLTYAVVPNDNINGYVSTFVTSFAPMKAALPPNVLLLSLNARVRSVGAVGGWKIFLRFTCTYLVVSFH